MDALRDPSLIVRARAGAAMSRLVGGIDVHYRADDPAEKREVAIGKPRYLREKVKKWQEESGGVDKGWGRPRPCLDDRRRRGGAAAARQGAD
ncbi:MAG: hypothetical protein AMK72_02010 [Planctomycetes bacterium SM23_25]|nr:MAG: hypothetical protein AMK72_02010 [Planctomycetes bacterium SM23_25]